MAILYASPNRVGQSAVFHTGSPDYLDISGGTALNNAMTALAAVSAGDLANGQTVGVYFYAGDETAGNYKVWRAVLDTASSELQLVEEERSIGTIANGTSVTAIVTDTQGMLEYYRKTPELANIVDVTTSTLVLTDAHAGKCLRCTVATTLTISTALSIGAQIEIDACHATPPIIARSGSDTINGGTANLALESQWHNGVIRKVATGAIEAYGSWS